MKVFLLLTVYFILTIDVISMQDSVNFQSEYQNTLLGHYSKAKIITSDYKKILVSEVSIFQDRVVFNELGSKQEKSIPLNDVIIINASKGTYWLAGTLMGGLGGVIIPVSLAMQNRKISSDAYIYSTLIGSAIGFIVGVSMDNYKTVYQSGDFFITFENNNTFNSYILNKNITIIKFQILIN